LVNAASSRNVCGIPSLRSENAIEPFSIVAR
jgi:hypothetical protein